MERRKSGFTLIELLVVIAILGILATVGFGQYASSQRKAKDVRRKTDLDNVARALETYYNDQRSYPISGHGKIVVDSVELSWGTDSFKKTVGADEMIYMTKLPADPLVSEQYCYLSDGTYYKLYSILENAEDRSYHTYTASCNASDYNYGIASPNTNP